MAYQVVRVAFVLVRLLVSSLVGWPRQGFSELVGDVHEPPAGAGGMSLHALARARLRRRSRWVCALQALLGGEIGAVSAYVSGRWLPDLPGDDASPVVNLLASWTEDGVEILGGGSLSAEGENMEVVPYLHVRRVDGSEFTVFPTLLAALANRAVFRTDSSALLASLKLKALEWRRSVGLPHHRLVFGLADTLALAMLPSSWSNRAKAVLAENGLPTSVTAY